MPPCDSEYPGYLRVLYIYYLYNKTGYSEQYSNNLSDGVSFNRGCDVVILVRNEGQAQLDQGQTICGDPGTERGPGATRSRANNMCGDPSSTKEGGKYWPRSATRW